MAIPTHITNALQIRKEENAFRSLKDNKHLIDFSSNDFFGLTRNVELQQNIHEEFAKTSVKNGSTGSRLLTGHSEIFTETEQFIASVTRAEQCLIFNSGYHANLSLLSSITTPKDTVIYDELAHASIKDGARLSMAKKYSFKHNSAEDLALKLQKAQGEKYVVVESLYSMDGDFCDIQPILEVCEKYQAQLIVDEAHTTGVYGEGAGWCVEKGVDQQVFARVMTFGKALGSFGACVLGSKVLIDYLINFARPFIYTTALPLYNVLCIRCSFEYILDHPQLREQLDGHIQQFQRLMDNHTSSAIQQVVYGSNDKARTASKRLMNKGFDVRPILSPTVKEGTERLRICLHTFNTVEEIETLVQHL